MMRQMPHLVGLIRELSRRLCICQQALIGIGESMPKAVFVEDSYRPSVAAVPHQGSWLQTEGNAFICWMRMVKRLGTSPCVSAGYRAGGARA